MHLSFTDNKSVIHIWLVHVSLKHTKSEKPARKNLGTCSAKVCHLGHLGALYTVKNLFSLKFETGSYFLKSIYKKILQTWANKISRHSGSSLETYL